MTRRVVAPQPATPALRTPPGGDLFRWLPTDVVEQTCRRVGVASMLFAGIWAWVLVMNNLVWRLFSHGEVHELSTWPWPGNLIAGAGLLASLAMVLVARRLHTQPARLIAVGLVFEVLTAFLVAALNWWVPGLVRGMGVSWIVVIILVYPAIVPASPARTLTAALAAASTDPLWYLIGVGRGLEYGADGFMLLWAFLPNYIAAFLAIVPARIIETLGRRVSRARELGAYRLGERLGAGGMGEVYRATHRLLARPAAIKLIRPEVLGGGTTANARIVVERFRREARAAALLRSPHTIELYDFGTTDEGNFYYVMEFLEGLDLQQMIERFGPLPAARVVHLLKQACLSLGEAHDRGLIHRDIKPSNLVACRLGLSVDFVKILDFGLVKQDPRHGEEAMHLTSPDVTTGTPAFMAPEIALGDRPVDRRADIYALGCVAYWLLAGRTVFEAPNAVSMLMQHVQEVPEPPSRYSELPVPEQLDGIVLDCLAKKPEDRPADALELYRRLADCPAPDPWNRNRAIEWWRLHLPEVFHEGEPVPWSETEETAQTDASVITEGSS